MTQLSDSLEGIRRGVQESLRRRPAAIITLGGLGPTYDDITLKGISQATGKPLRLNREALRLVKEHYQRLDTKPILTKYRTKMATLPTGAIPLPNPVGTAPGVRMRVRKSTIYSLPGVPSEMKAIYRNSIEPSLKFQNGNRPRGVQLKIAGIIESALAPILEGARHSFPGLYFKSHPRGRETGVTPLILLHIYNIVPEGEFEIAKAVEFVVNSVADASRMKC